MHGLPIVTKGLIRFTVPNGETFSQLLLLQLLDHHASKAIYIHPNDNIEKKYGLLTRAYPIFQAPVDSRYEARCRNKLRCLSRLCKLILF